MKAREPRRKVLIDARLRQDCGWSDAHILNISRSGLMVRAPQAPPRGVYVEICRGTHRIIARVVWATHDHFGARTQDAIAVEAMTRGEDASPAEANDRRQSERQTSTQRRQEGSRRWSRRFQFIVLIGCSCAASAIAFATVRDALSTPLRLIEIRLAH